MKNSEKFVQSIKDDKSRSIGMVIILQGIFALISIFLLLHYRLDFSNIRICYYLISGVIIISALIILFAVKYSAYFKMTDDKYKIIVDELDNKIDNIFEEYGIYITENYLVHMSYSISTHSFAVPLKDILAISDYGNGGYVYSKKKRKNSILRMIVSTIFDFADDGTKNVQNVIVVTNKKRYRLGYYYNLNGKKAKELENIVKYICDKNRKIDWI